MRHSFLIACILPFIFPVVVSGNDVRQYLEDGNKYLLSGQYNDAITNFDAAIRQEPRNHVSYYKRATAYMSLGRNQAAVNDFSHILQIKPDFVQALMQRAKLYAKLGDLALARQDLKKYLKLNKGDKDATELLKAATDSEAAIYKAEKALKTNDFDTCILQSSDAIKTSPFLASLRLMRAKCLFGKGDVEEATGDMTRAVQLDPENSDVIIQLAKINYFALGDSEGAVTQLKQCLYYDPEQKNCKALFRMIKKVNHRLEDVQKEYKAHKYASASDKLVGTTSKPGLMDTITEQHASLQKELGNRHIPERLLLKCYELACQIYGRMRPMDTDKVEQWCTSTLQADRDHVDALMYRGEAHLKAGDYEAAARDLDHANQVSGGQNRRINQLRQQVEQKRRRSKQTNYYKILDVSPDADAKEIKRAYRKKAQEWHPDKHDASSKERAEKRMAEINRAYEVLSDDDMRQQYDNGFDPYDNDPSQQQQRNQYAQQRGHGGGGFNPFQQGNPFGQFQGGGFPFGNDGSFTFKMHF